MSTSVLILGMRYSNFRLCYVVFDHKIYFYHFSQQGHSGRKYSIYLLVFMLLAGSFICFWEVASSSHGTLHLRIFWCPLIFPGSQENLFWLISFQWTIQNISLLVHLILEWNSDFFQACSSHAYQRRMAMNTICVLFEFRLGAEWLCTFFPLPLGEKGQ